MDVFLVFCLKKLLAPQGSLISYKTDYQRGTSAPLGTPSPLQGGLVMMWVTNRERIHRCIQQVGDHT